MRCHLIRCIEQGTMESFPQKKHRRIPLGNQYKKTMSTKIYCVCRMPNQTSKAMVKCDSCGKWMHKECMGLDQMAVVEGVWYSLRRYLMGQKEPVCTMCLDSLK